MTGRRLFFTLVGLYVLLVGGAAKAEDGVLVVHVTYLDKKTPARVRIGVVKDGSTERTDANGQARLRLATGVKEEQEVTLQVVPLSHDQGPWVFISPWDQRVHVPSFSRGKPVPVVLARQADKKALLNSSEGRKAIEQSILSELSKLRNVRTEITEEQRRTVLQAQASVYGLKLEEVDAAIRAASQKSQDLFEQGLAALYEKNYPVASERLEKAMAATEQKETKLQEELTQVHEERGNVAFFLGQSRYEEGRYPEAVISFKEATKYQGEHAETLNGLGLALLAAGNYPEAAIVLNSALDADERTKSTLRTVIEGNLALVLKHRGDLIGARQLGEHVLEARRRQLGDNHPDTLTAMDNLALTLREQGDLPKAVHLQEQALESFRRQLGSDHPDTLAAMENLAESFRQQGDLALAAQLQEQVLESLRRKFGADHPNTLTAMDNLAVTLEEKGDLQKAMLLQEQAFESLRRQFGADHPDTLTTMANLAATLEALGFLPKARQLEEQVLESRRHLLGADHPDTLMAMANLAEILHAQGDLQAAKILEEHVLTVRRRLLGPRHPDTSVTEWNLLLTLKDLRDEEGVRDLKRSLVWLLNSDVAVLSAQQRQIRRALQKMRQE
jgi:tetratricopeptide (TPR) repeat protein